MIPAFPSLLPGPVPLTFLVPAQVAPDHHWVGFADKAGSNVDLDPNAGTPAA